jgi:hypothetical protein
MEIHSFNFLKLPPEIRLLVYEELLISATPLQVNDMDGRQCYDNQDLSMAFLRTCRQIYSEASAVYYQNTLSLSTDRQIFRIWGLNEPQGFARMRNVIVNVTSVLDNEPFKELLPASYLPAIACTRNNVRKVVTVHQTQKPWRSGFSPTTADRIRIESVVSDMQQQLLAWGEEFIKK